MITILKRTESHHRAYADFDPVRIARFDDQDVARLMQDTGIIRNRLKVQSIIKTPAPIWRWRPKASTSRTICGLCRRRPHGQPAPGNGDIPATSPESDAMSKALKNAALPSSAAPSATPLCRRWAW